MPTTDTPGLRPTLHNSSGEIARLVLAAGGTVFVLFLIWQGIEDGFATTETTRHLMHFARGISSSLITAGVVGWMLRNNHRRRAAALEREIEERTRDAENARASFEAVVEHTPAGLLIIDTEHRVIYANSTAKKLHGGDIQPGQACHTSVGCSQERCSRCPAPHVLQTGVGQAMETHRSDPRTGEVIMEEFYPLCLPNGQQYVLVVEKIVTQQHKLQASLVHQEKMAAFGLLAAGIAHDLGNPLSAIDMHMQLMEDEDLTPELAESVKTVRRETGRLRRTLRDLVDFARRRGSDASLVDVAEVARDALRLLRYDKRMRRVDVELEADPHTPPVFVVEDHLMQVVLNLMVNALDAMPDGGKLKVEVEENRGEVAMRVHDTGNGMDRDILDRCYEPLFTTKAPGKGTGLGLSMCKDIVEREHGTLELHSAPGRGTTAVVTLPVTQSAVLPVIPGGMNA